MRVTTTMLTDTLVNNLRQNLVRLENLQRQLTTGKRISRPSDDPVAVGRALAYRSGIAAGEQYIRTMDSALAWLDLTDATLDSVTKAMQRARELAVQGANDTLGPAQHQAIASEINQLLEQMILLGNSSLRGQRLFAGAEVDANPFTPVGSPITSVTYNGDTAAMVREIDVNTTIAINVAGDAIFQPIFTALIDLRDDLQASNTTDIRQLDLPALDSAIDNLLAVRAEVGSRVNRIEAARERQNLLQVRLQDLLSKAEDTDFTEALTRFTIQENVYKAALQTGSKAVQPSLLDYLR